jgi:hypothetical protein
VTEPTNIEEILAQGAELFEKTSRGEWKVVQPSPLDPPDSIVSDYCDVAWCGFSETTPIQREANAALIAFLHNNYEALSSALLEARARQSESDQEYREATEYNGQLERELAEARARAGEAEAREIKAAVFLNAQIMSHRTRAEKAVALAREIFDAWGGVGAGWDEEQRQRTVSWASRLEELS